MILRKVVEYSPRVVIKWVHSRCSILIISKLLKIMFPCSNQGQISNKALIRREKRLLYHCWNWRHSIHRKMKHTVTRSPKTQWVRNDSLKLQNYNRPNSNITSRCPTLTLTSELWIGKILTQTIGKLKDLIKSFCNNRWRSLHSSLF